MVYYEQIDRLQKQYTDKYVVVDDSRPELRRFAGQTGIVKTVNMNGRALVQFDAFNNIGWYDIDPAYLRVVDAPLPKPEAKKEKAAPSKGEKAPPNAAEKPAPAAKPAAAAPKGGGSVADILAAARGGAKPAPAKPAEAAATSAPAQPAKPAAANPKAMSVADILAAARGKSAPTAAAPAGTPKAEVTKPAAATPAAPARVEAPPAPEPAAQPAVAAAAAPAASGKRSKRDQITAISEMVAYCRATDAG